MKNSSISTKSQLSKRINQLNNLISKFPRVRSLIRKWAFELTILDTYYRKLNKTPPWSFWQIRDTRTLFDLGYDPEMPKEGLHNALEDASRQAIGVQTIYRKLNRFFR